MQKLVDAFKLNPSDKNAEKIVKHARKSLMSVCFISPADRHFLRLHKVNI